MHVTRNQHTHTQTKARFSRLLERPGWKHSRTILVEWVGMEKQESM